MPKRILFLNHHAFLGGAEIVLLRFIKYVNRDLIEPIAIVAEEGSLTKQLRFYDVETHVIPVDPRNLAQKRTSYELNPIRLFQDLNFCRKQALKIAKFTLAGYFSNIPVIWRFHDILSKDTFAYPLRKFISFLANTKPVVKILAISKAVENSLKEQGIKHWKISTVYNGVETLNKSANDNRVRQEYYIPSSAALIGMIGRIIYWKGQKTLIEAASKVLKDNPDVVLLIIGCPFSEEDREYEKGLKKLAEKLDLRNKTIFTGFRNDVYSILQELDLVVHASLKPEPLGMVILEAMAAARPVIASNCGGVPEMIEHKKTGLLFPCGDSNALADCIRHALFNKSTMYQLGQNAKKRVLERFSVEKYVQVMERVLSISYRV
jgi:glycosyltransferase involved in cell wall biosynthesis